MTGFEIALTVVSSIVVYLAGLMYLIAWWGRTRAAHHISAGGESDQIIGISIGAVLGTPYVGMLILAAIHFGHQWPLYGGKDKFSRKQRRTLAYERELANTQAEATRQLKEYQRLIKEADEPVEPTKEVATVKPQVTKYDPIPTRLRDQIEHEVDAEVERQLGRRLTFDERRNYDRQRDYAISKYYKPYFPED